MPKGFLLALLLIFGFESFIAMIPEYKLLDPPFEKSALALKGDLVDKPNSFNIIILGDCTGWSAIKPLEIEKELHKTAINLAVNGAQTYLMSYILLKRYLSNCRKTPELVILQLSANSMFYIWGMNPDALNYHILPWFRVDDDFIHELSRPMQWVCFKNKLLQVLPSLRNQFFLQKGFWLPRVWKSDRTEFDKYMSYYREQKGFYNQDLDPNKKKIEKIEDIGENFKHFTISEFNMNYIKKILQVLSHHDIKVIVCLTPIRDDEMSIWTQYNLRERLNNKISELIKPYSNVIAFWDMQSIASDPKYFIDWSHLDSMGAIIYTNELVKKIKSLELFSLERTL